MAATVGIVPDIANALTVPKKGVVPSVTPPSPKVGEIWPRGAKNTAG